MLFFRGFLNYYYLFVLFKKKSVRKGTRETLCTWVTAGFATSASRSGGLNVILVLREHGFFFCFPEEKILCKVMSGGFEGNDTSGV